MVAAWVLVFLGWGACLVGGGGGGEVPAPKVDHTQIDTTGCPDTFHQRCHCGMTNTIYDNRKTSRFTVNCTKSGFTTTIMLLDLPEETEVLIFTGNSVSELHPNIFGNTKDYANLDVIDFSNNHIRSIDGKAFHKVASVRTLILNHNDLVVTNKKTRIFSNFENLQSLHLTNAFTESINSTDYLLDLEEIFFDSALMFLKVLHLEQNEIWSIGKNPKVFCELEALEQLLLGDNRIHDLDFTIDCLKNLVYIDLERNAISRLSKEAMVQLDLWATTKDDAQVKLSDNRFVCDCRSKDFVEWVSTTKVKLIDKETYKCADGWPEENIHAKLSKARNLCSDVYTGLDAKKNKETNKVGAEHSSTSSSKSQDPGRRTLNISKIPEGGHSSATVGVLSFLLMFVCSILVATMYYQRSKLKALVMPHLDFITSKIGYTGLANEEAPREASV